MYNKKYFSDAKMNEMDSLRYWLWFVNKEMGGGERPPLQGS